MTHQTIGDYIGDKEIYAIDLILLTKNNTIIKDLTNQTKLKTT